MRLHRAVRELPSAVRDLGKRAERSAFCLGFDWYEVFEARVANTSGQEVLLSAHDDDGTALAMLPLWAPVDSTPRPQRFTGLANYYTPLFQPWVCADLESASLGMKLIAKELCANHSWSRISLTPIDARNPVWQSFRDEMHNQGMYSYVENDVANWTVSVSGMSYTSYMQQRASRVRNTIKRRAKKLQQCTATRFELVTSEEGLAAALDAYETIYGKSWKHVEAYPAFIRELASMCARRNWLRLGLLHVDDCPAAAQFWIVSHGVASIFKLAYDPAFEEFSVGTLLMTNMLQRVIDVDHVDTIDFLTGDDAYKKDWMTDRGERQTLLLLSPATIDGFSGVARNEFKHMLQYFGWR